MLQSTAPLIMVSVRAALASWVVWSALLGQEAPRVAREFIEHHCLECHDTETANGQLDLSSLAFALGDAKTADRWVMIHDRVDAGEMPPAKKPRPPAAATTSFLAALATPLIAADQARETAHGRATWRRLNRSEYEYSLRDLLQAPWLQVKSFLPEDGEAHRFNKIGDALDISHVQMAQYLAAAEHALRAVLAPQADRPVTETKRHYARDQAVFAKKMLFNEFNRSPERATFPVLDYAGQPEVRAGKLPLTRGDQDPATREREAMGTVASSYEPIELRFDRFRAPVAGRYRIRLNAYAVWVGPGKEPPKDPKKEVVWWRPDLDDVSPGRRAEPVTISAESAARQVRWQGAVDVGVTPTVNELELWLLAGETIRVDAARLFRSRPGAAGGFHNPLAEKDGQPAVAFKWLEVEGPLIDSWPTQGHRLLAGDLPLKSRSEAGTESGAVLELEPKDPAVDGERLVRAFIARAYRRPVEEADVQRYLGLLRSALAAGNSFTDALIATYAGVLCSPGFICLEERPGKLGDHALAARLSYFLWNSEPDAELRQLANRGELAREATLAAQTRRLLDDPRSARFTTAFLDYWLDLRHIDATSPDAELYPDYYLDDLLVESAMQETQAFFAELVRADLPARSVVASDFAMLNERLAQHYGLPAVAGVAIRKVTLPTDSVRGGLMTQASVLKVTANGTTTSPVVRGAWVMERILGLPPPPPPPNIPAVEPDIRGAKTIREQLAKHRSQESCAACHTKIDPAGFALEQFDILGGARERYRATGDGQQVVGFGKNGHPFAFHAALPVDPTGNLPDGRAFTDVRALKQLLLADERQIARNLARQLVIYATGAPIRFGDRARIEQILDRTAKNGYGLRSLITAIVESSLFQHK